VSQPRARRDFLLDSGAVSYLATHFAETRVWLRQIATLYEEPGVFVPVPVISECKTGDPRRDAPVDRLFSMIAPPGRPTGYLLGLTHSHAERAAVIRTQAISRTAGHKGRISVTDAHVVAMAEERSYHNAVTILTSDPDDLRLLVELTGARNIGVQVL
jgi:hypothetical protein